MPRSRTPTTPCTDCAMGLLVPVARNPAGFFQIAIRFRQSRPDVPRPRNGPFRLNRRVPGGKIVIAVDCAPRFGGESTSAKALLQAMTLGGIECRRTALSSFLVRRRQALVRQTLGQPYAIPKAHPGVTVTDHVTVGRRLPAWAHER